MDIHDRSHTYNPTSRTLCRSHWPCGWCFLLRSRDKTSKKLSFYGIDYLLYDIFNALSSNTCEERNWFAFYQHFSGTQKHYFLQRNKILYDVKVRICSLDIVFCTLKGFWNRYFTVYIEYTITYLSILKFTWSLSILYVQ